MPGAAAGHNKAYSTLLTGDGDRSRVDDASVSDVRPLSTITAALIIHSHSFNSKMTERNLNKLCGRLPQYAPALCDLDL